MCLEGWRTCDGGLTSWVVLLVVNGVCCAGKMRRNGFDWQHKKTKLWQICKKLGRKPCRVR